RQRRAATLSARPGDARRALWRRPVSVFLRVWRRTAAHLSRLQGHRARAYSGGERRVGWTFARDPFEQCALDRQSGLAAGAGARQAWPGADGLARTRAPARRLPPRARTAGRGFRSRCGARLPCDVLLRDGRHAGGVARDGADDNDPQHCEPRHRAAIWPRRDTVRRNGAVRSAHATRHRPCGGARRTPPAARGRGTGRPVAAGGGRLSRAGIRHRANRSRRARRGLPGRQRDAADLALGDRRGTRPCLRGRCRQLPHRRARPWWQCAWRRRVRHHRRHRPLPRLASPLAARNRGHVAHRLITPQEHSVTPNDFPRVDLGFFPTPIEPLRRLSAALGVTLSIKRDDYTGFGGGGNKVRKLEFLMADALAQNAGVLITTGGHQSNHARMVAAAARRFGMRAVLVLRGHPPKAYQGNLLLDRIFGATLEFLDPDAYFTEIDPRMAAHADAARVAGQVPYIIPLGGANPLGALGYVRAI